MEAPQLLQKLRPRGVNNIILTDIEVFVKNPG
jgi:hypothetical protein